MSSVPTTVDRQRLCQPEADYSQRATGELGRVNEIHVGQVPPPPDPLRWQRTARFSTLALLVGTIKLT